MKKTKIKKLFEEKINFIDKEERNVPINKFHAIITNTEDTIIISLHYYKKEGICLLSERKIKNNEDIDKTLETLKIALILEILYEEYKEIIEKNEKLIENLKNSEDWYKYDIVAKELIEKAEVPEEERNFLSDYLELKERN